MGNFNIVQPVVSETAATKANKVGDDFTNPATWRSGLDVPENAAVHRLSAPGLGGVNFYGVASTKLQGPTNQTIGTTPVSLWLRLVVPASLATTRGLLALGPDAAYMLGSGGNSFGIASVAAASDICLVMGDGTNYTRYPLGLSAYAGKVVDIVVTRTGSTLAGYVNGNAVTLTGTAAGSGCAANAAVTATYATIAGPLLSGATGTSDATLLRATAFNRALGASEVVALLRNGIDPADQFGTSTPIIGPSTLNGGFETAGGGGADVFGSWVESAGTGGSFVRETAGTYAGAASAHVVAGSTTGTSLYQNVGLLFGKRYRVTFAGKSTVGSPSVWMRVGGAGASNATNTKALTGSWVVYEFEEVNVSTSATTYFYIQAPTVSTEFWVDDVTINQIGAFMDCNLGIGVGTFAPDQTPNMIGLDGSGAFDHVVPVRGGHFTVVRNFAHSEISSSAATTRLFDLPPNCGIVRVEFERPTALDGGITLNVGVSGTATKFVNAQAVSTTGISVVASSDLASQSATANTPVYVQKSGATTVGQVRVRAVVEVRG